jgi:hypothetical protein
VKKQTKKTARGQPATLGTIYAPGFMEMLTEYADHVLGEWLNHNAPESVATLHHSLTWLNYVRQAGAPDDEARQLTIEAVIQVINLIVDLGGTWAYDPEMGAAWDCGGLR